MPRTKQRTLHKTTAQIKAEEKKAKTASPRSESTLGSYIATYLIYSRKTMLDTEIDLSEPAGIAYVLNLEHLVRIKANLAQNHPLTLTWIDLDAQRQYETAAG